MAVKELMKIILLLSLGLGFSASAQVDFVSYLKRNNQVIGGKRKETEKVAFKDKQRFLASVPEEAKKTEVPAIGLDSKGETPKDPATSEAEAGADSTPSDGGPNR